MTPSGVHRNQEDSIVFIERQIPVYKHEELSKSRIKAVLLTGRRADLTSRPIVWVCLKQNYEEGGVD